MIQICFFELRAPSVAGSGVFQCTQPALGSTANEGAAPAGFAQNEVYPNDDCREEQQTSQRQMDS